MRTSLTRATTLFSSLVSATAIPPSTLDSFANDITAVAGTTSSDHLSIHVLAPCQGCFPDPDQRLELVLDIDSSDDECNNSPRLNGLALPFNHGNDGPRQVTFISKSADGQHERNINASWDSVCLKGQASFLSVRIHDVDVDDSTARKSGFTASFKQKGKPTVLRLQDQPLSELNLDILCNSWLDFDSSKSPSITPLKSETSLLDGLFDAEHNELNGLLSHLQDTHNQVVEAGKGFFSLLKDEIKSCSSWTCYWKAIKNNARVLCDSFESHQQHHKSRVSGCTEDDTQSVCQADQTQSDMTVTLNPEGKLPSTTRALSSSAKPTSVQAQTLPADTPTATPSPQEEHSVPEPPLNPDGESEHDPWEPGHGPPPWFSPEHGDGPPFGHHGPPPWFKPHDGGNGPPPGHHGPPPWFKPGGGRGPPPWAKPGQGPPPWMKPGHGPPPGHHGPPPWFKPGAGSPPPWFRPGDGHPGFKPGGGPPPWFRPGENSPYPGHHGPPRGPFSDGHSGAFLDYGITFALVSFILLVISGGLLFKIIRTCRDPRRRAECAARIEERRTKRLYRKAAYKHRWNQFWRRALHMAKAADEEKTAAYLGEETRADSLFRRQLRTLRDASDLVRNLVAAEEGRARPGEDYSGPSTEPAPQYVPSMATGSDSRLMTEIPPMYLAPPPRYDEDLAGEITVVDGFRYTPSNSGYTPSISDGTPESSIVDCSPRLSLETGRSTILTKDEKD